MKAIARTTPNKAREILADCALFRGLAPTKRDGLIARSHLRHFTANQTVFAMGAPGDSMMAVVSGRVRISVPSADGKEIVLALLGPGEIFGEIALLDGKQRSADVTVASDSACLAVLDRRDMFHFFDSDAAAWRALVEVLCERLRSTDDHIAEIALLQVPVRLARALIRLLDQQDQPAAAGSASPLRFSQRELGNMVGATRETINKCLRDWHKRGVVRIEDGGITLTDREALEEIADPV